MLVRRGNTHILCHIEDEGRLTHGRAGSDDDEVALLEAARQSIQGREARRNACDRFLIAELSGNFFQLVLHGFPDRREVALSFIPRDFEDGLFRIVRDVFDRILLGIRFLGMMPAASIRRRSLALPATISAWRSTDFGEMTFMGSSLM